MKPSSGESPADPGMHVLFLWKLTVSGCLLTDDDRDGSVVTLCRAYMLSVSELVNMLLLILKKLFFYLI